MLIPRHVLRSTSTDGEKGTLVHKACNTELRLTVVPSWLSVVTVPEYFNVA